MPNITVTFQDGSKHVYQNAPDGLTPEQVTERAQQEFGKQVTALDGGRKAAPVASGTPRRSLTTQRASSAIQNAEQAMLKRLEGATEKQRREALRKFHSDPRIQNIRKDAGLAPARTREEEIQEIARERVRARREATPDLPGRDFLSASTAAIGRNLFGIPERLSAGAKRVLGIDEGRDYADQLAIERAVTDEEAAQSMTGNILGSIAGAGLGGGAAGGAVRAAGARLAQSGAPALARAGRALEGAATVRQGQRLKNTAKIVAAGGAGGAAQALGEGSDVSTGAAYGAGGAAALVGGGRAAEFLSRPVRDFLNSSSAAGILRRYTTATAEQMQEAADAFRRQTGAEPTVFEVLPLDDRQAVREALGLMPGSVRERATNLVRERAGAIGQELSEQAGRIVRPQQQRAAQTMAGDLAQSRGDTAPTPEELALTQRAIRSPVELEQVRADEARNVMAPYDSRVAYEKLDALMPVTPVRRGRSIVEEINDPQVAEVIRSAAGILRRRSDEGITVRDISDIMSELRDDVARGGVEGRVAQRAINHLEDILNRDHPDVMPAIGQMTEAFASRSRMLEGVQEGARTRLREDVPVTDRRVARQVRQSYDTPEGSAGRAMGQAAQIERDMLSSPERALSAAQQIANSPARQEAISRNLGTTAGNDIAAAARAQQESAQRLSGLTRDQSGASSAMPDLAELTRSLVAISPSALPSTRFWALGRLTRLFRHLPERQSEDIVNALFSRNPTHISRAMRLLNNQGDAGREAIRTISRAVSGGQIGGQAGQALNEPDTMQEVAPVQPAAIPEEQNEPAAIDGGPYSAQLQEIYNTESPELLDLIERVQGRESNGRQLDETGAPLQSSAGAVGIMQVMPGTAPEAAQLAGVPFDEEAYQFDEEYNKLIGIAYLSEMLRQFDGDVEKATAAYNAGPGAVRSAIRQDAQNWLAFLPTETQEYVRSVA